MKKILTASLPVFTYLTFASSAFAAIQPTAIVICPTDGLASTLCKSNINFGNIVGVIINAFFLLAIIAALIYLIYGGIRWIISQGDKSKVEAARNHILAAVIGLVLVFMSYLILSLVLQIFGLGDLNSLQVPSLNP
jgi:hypothetical protein